MAVKLKGRGVFGNGEGGKDCTVPGSVVDARDDADPDDAVLGNDAFEGGPDGNPLAWGVPGGKFPDGVVPF